jgi:hypothetical protein
MSGWVFLLQLVGRHCAAPTGRLAPFRLDFCSERPALRCAWIHLAIIYSGRRRSMD